MEKDVWKLKKCMTALTVTVPGFMTGTHAFMSLSDTE